MLFDGVHQATRFVHPLQPRSGPGDRLRIAFVADTFEGSVSGGAISAVRFVRALRAVHDVVVVAAADESRPGLVAQPGFQLPVHAMRASGFTMARPRRAALDAAIASADVVHLQFPFWLSFAALASARRAGVPVVAAFHVQPENLLMNVGLRAPWLVRALYRFWIRRLYDRADAVVCPTAFAEETLRHHGAIAPTFVVSNGVPAGLRRPSLRREPEYDGKFLILMVGRLAPEKRQDIMLDALPLCRHRDRIRLVIAGTGPSEDAIRRRARTLDPAPEVGFVSDARLQRFYNTADLLVHCGEVELEGMAVLEALGCGLPGLIADSPTSAAARLALGPEFLFTSGSPAALAARIDGFVEHPERIVRARGRALDRARSLGADQSVARLIGVYRSVVRRERVAAVG